MCLCLFLIVFGSGLEMEKSDFFQDCMIRYDFWAQLSYSPQSTEVFYPDHGEAENEPIEKVYVTTLVTPMGLASSFNGRISKIMVKKWANFENSINHYKNGLVWCM